MAPNIVEGSLYLAAGMGLFLSGAIVLLLGKRQPAALAFASYGVGLGSVYTIYGLIQLEVLADFPLFLLWLAAILVLAGVWGLFAWFPRRIARAEAIPAVIAAAIALAVAGGIALARSLQGGGWVAAPTISSSFGSLFFVVAARLWGAGEIAAGLLFAMRARSLPAAERSTARSLGILAVGFVLFRAPDARALAASARGDYLLAEGLLYAVVVLLIPLLWVRATRGAHRRVARNVVIAVVAIHLAMVFLDLAVAAMSTSSSSTSMYVGGFGRILGGLLLAYAVLRGQIAGLDLKVRFALSKSTVAAVFIAVFFIASEGAQLLFGQQNELVGLAAAGALVFAMAPLQRLADRLALKAVPVSAAAPVSNGKDDAFRSAVRLALRGGITRREEHDLALLADNLGLNAKRALELREEVEQRGPAA